MIENYGNWGSYNGGDGKVLTYEIQGALERDSFQTQFVDVYRNLINEDRTLRLDEFLIPIWGDRHNLYPQEVAATIAENKLLPELIEKQIEYAYGQGYYLYSEKIDGTDKLRVPAFDAEIEAWLQSWPLAGVPSVEEYILRALNEYYHVVTVPTLWYFHARRRTGGSRPVAALEVQGSDMCRLATRRLVDLPNRRIFDRDCRHVVVGDWLNINREQYDVYNRLDDSDPVRFDSAISFTRKKSFGRELYASNQWFDGLREWIRGANLSPKYINSYLKNALNARIHVIIPYSWYMSQHNTLKEICLRNNMNPNQIQKEYRGVKLVNSEGKPLDFQEYMITELVNFELRQITELMSGEGKNQGKLWASIKYNSGSGEADAWEFKEIPSKYKEFVESIIAYDRRSDEVILAGKGIPSSISNVEKDGILSKSGSDVYYNYMIYTNALTITEYYVLYDLNRALSINFPGKNLKVGLYHRVVEKQQNVSPSNRMDNATSM